MQEILDQVVEQVRGVWRFRRYALIAAWVLAILSWLLIFAMPDVYQANSRVFVDTKTALKPAIEGLVLDQDVSAQLNFVRQSLLAGPQLEPVAQEVGLVDTRVMSPQQRARALDDMRERVVITVAIAAADTHQDTPERDAGSIYSIQYSDVSRDRSLKVVEILQSRLIEQTLGGKRQGSENAQKFLGVQIQEYEKRLAAAEDRLAEFKKKNVGLMPDEQGGYFTRLQAEIDAVNAGKSQLAIAISRRDELQRQLRGEAPIAAAAGVVTNNTQSGATSGGDTLSRIKEMQARLDELLLRFTDKHPDVVATRETLEQLKVRRENELAALRRGDPNAAATSGASSSPVYQSIQLALNQAEVEIVSLRRQLSDHENKVADLRKNLDTMPQVEAEYARLDRDYGVTKANYTALVERLEKSRLGEEATTSGSVRFDVIDPPFAPFRPVSPNRPLLILAAWVVAIGLGIGIAFLLHLLRPVYNTSRGLEESTGLPVLGAVSMTWLERHLNRRRRSYWRYSTAITALFIAAGIAVQLSRMGVRFGGGA